MTTDTVITWPIEMDNEPRTPKEEIRRRAHKHFEARGERLPMTWPVEMDNQPRTPEEEIRRRAYEYYEARGREDCHDLDDWFRAEEEINREIRVAAA